MHLRRSLALALTGAIVAFPSSASSARPAAPGEPPKPAATPARPPAEKPLAVRLADSVLSRWPDPSAIGNRGWEYNSGIVLAGIAEVYRHTRDPRYLAYIRRYVDTYLRPDGSLDLGEDSGGHNLDRFQPGVLVLFLYEETREGKYAKAARWLRGRFDSFPRNAVGGFWHKQKYPNEMWLDGIYMAEPFLAGYGALFGEPKFCFETAVAQATLVGAHTRVPGTGLFRHAWDEDRNAAWADPATGISPEVWSRAMGWYVMALVDILEKLPVDQPGRSKLRELLREAAGGIRSTQDPKTGLWFQVTDKAERPGNWLETSASGMFVYALKRSVDRGDLDAGLLTTAKKGWTGLLSRVTEDSEGRPVVEGTVEGISVQKDFAGYVGKRRLANTPHGLCGLLLASSAMEWPDAHALAGRAAAEPDLTPAFPGAEGFGAFARGGRGGDVYHVTSLNDVGSGSLRDGIRTAASPRTIVFDLSGTIFLKSPLSVDRPFLTLDGETAPGGGITVAGFTTSILNTHDVVVRYLRFRPGDIECPGMQDDSLNIVRSTDVLIDHVSASWSIDETLSVTHATRVTVQWSLITESLDHSCHQKGRHGYGSLLRYGDGGLTFHHNLYAHHDSRSPRLGDDLGLDFVNNVVYDWGFEAGYSGPAAEGSPRLNYVANVLVAGPSTPVPKRGFAFRGGSEKTRIFQSGNVVDANVNHVRDASAAGWELFTGSFTREAARFDFPRVTTDDARTAYARVLAEAGASHFRDAVDARVLAEVAGDTGSLIDSQRQVGGWPELRTVAAPAAREPAARP